MTDIKHSDQYAAMADTIRYYQNIEKKLEARIRELEAALDGVKSDEGRMAVLDLAVLMLSHALDEFIACCMDRSPTPGEIAKARGYLPPYCKHAYHKGKKDD